MLTNRRARGSRRMRSTPRSPVIVLTSQGFKRSAKNPNNNNNNNNTGKLSSGALFVRPRRSKFTNVAAESGSHSIVSILVIVVILINMMMVILIITIIVNMIIVALLGLHWR